MAKFIVEASTPHQIYRIKEIASSCEPMSEKTCYLKEVGVVDESGYYLSGITRDKCSNCGFVDDPQMWAEVYDYCPKCGHKVQS